MNTARCLLLVTLVLFLSACSGKFFGAKDEGSVPEMKTTGTANYYYDFDDILVPRDMALQPKSSFVLETPGVKAGVLAFKGRVNSVSLTSFFMNNMLKDGWQLSSSFKYRRTILVYTKPDRDCIINIIDNRFTTSLEIWIAPKGNAAATSSRQERTLMQ